MEETPCHSREELRRYYRRNGILLGICYLLGSRDLHYENVIAHGEYPVIIDLEMGVWLDLEWSKQRALGKRKVKKIAEAFMKVIRKGGYECGIYCNRDWYINVCGGLNAKYWIARYPAADDGTLKSGLKPHLGEAGWQYSSKGKVSGIAGNVDLDIWYEEKT